MHVEHGVRLELANLFERFKGGLSHISILESCIHNLLVCSFLTSHYGVGRADKRLNSVLLSKVKRLDRFDMYVANLDGIQTRF
jgi:hypothetical protein